MSRVPSRSTAQWLGPLELLVLDALWRHGTQDVAGMHHVVCATRSVSRNTVHSTLERLVRKDLASRSKVGRAYEYRPTCSRSEWIADSLAELVGSIPGSDQALMLAGFVDLAEQTGEEALEALEHLVRERRRLRSEGE